MNAGDDAERLPSAIGALVDLALYAYGKRFALSTILALAVFVLVGIAEFTLPASIDGDTHNLVMVLLELFGFGFVVGTIALGVASGVAGSRLERTTLLRGALYRWPGVFGALLFAWATWDFTAVAGGVGPDADAATLILAPIAWLLWGAVSIAGPIAALSPEMPVLSAFTSFWRALMLSLRLTNLSRLAVVAFATVIPLLLETLVLAELKRRGIAHADFWSSLPIDCLLVGPLTALQTVFALDFARRDAKV